MGPDNGTCEKMASQDYCEGYQGLDRGLCRLMAASDQERYMHTYTGIIKLISLV